MARKSKKAKQQNYKHRKAGRSVPTKTQNEKLNFKSKDCIAGRIGRQILISDGVITKERVVEIIIAKRYEDIAKKEAKLEQQIKDNVPPEKRISRIPQKLDADSAKDTRVYKTLMRSYLVQRENDKKDIFRPSAKFQTEYRNYDREFKLTGKHEYQSWKFSKGEKHEEGSMNFSSLIPNTVIDDGRFISSGTMSKIATDTRETKAFIDKADKIIEDKLVLLREANKIGDTVTADRLRSEINYLSQDGYNNFLAPDLKLTLTRDEAEELRDRLADFATKCYSKNSEDWRKASRELERKINETPSGRKISICAEIITSEYSANAKAGHEAYNQASGESCMFIPSR